MSLLIFKYKEVEYRIPSKVESVILYAKMFKEYSKNIPEYKLYKEIIFESNSQKDEIIKSLKRDIDFKIINDTLLIPYKLNNKEIKEIKQNYLKEYNRFLNILYSYYKKDEYKKLIEAYLNNFNLKYLIKELNKIKL